MALASLTIDLTLGLARFEGDVGRVTQIATRESQKLERARQSLLKQLEREAESAGRSRAEVLALKAAYLGLTEQASKYIEKIAEGERRTSTVAGGDAITQAASREIAANAQRSDSQRELVQSINAVAVAYQKQQRELIQSLASGQITPESFKAQIQAAGEAAKAAVQDIRTKAAQQQAARELADQERAAAEERRAAAQKVIDVQNGLSASYRSQLAALRELRDAGALTPQQFRQAGTELVSRQPGVQQREREAAQARKAAEEQAEAAKLAAQADVDAVARRRAAFADLEASLSGFTQNYRRALATLNEAFSRGDIGFDRFQQLKAQLNEQQNPLVIQYRQQQEAAKRAADEVAAAAKRKADAEQEAANRFVQSLQQQADAIGKTRSQLLLEEAARRGVADQVRPYIERIDAAEKNLKKFGRTSGVARYQLLTLQYTISDTVASLASGISPLTILLQQGGQVLDVFGSVGNVFRTIGAVLTPMRVAVGGAAGVLAGFAYAAYQGAEQSKQFADAVTLTGNFAGLTEGRFNALTKTVAASGQVLVSAAREYGQALISTGQISTKNFDAATEAAARFGAATGKSAKEVAQEFAQLGEDVTAGASKLNQTYNFLTAAQLIQIRQLQEQGRSTDALSIVYDALNQRLRSLEPNLGILDRTLRTVKGAWADFWDAAFDIGRAETIEQRLEKARQAAERVRNVGTERASQTQLDPERRARLSASRPQDIENADEQVRLLLRSQAAQQDAARAAAESAANERRAVSADAFVQGYLKRAKSVEALNKALDEARRKFTDLEKVGQPVSADQQKAILDQIREEFTDKGKVRDALKLQKAERDAALKFITDELKTERDAYQFQNQYLQGIYQQGLVSLQNYYAGRRDAIERDTQAQLNAIDAQIAVQQRFLQSAQGRDPAAAVDAEKNIASLNEQAKQIVADRQRAVVLANVEEAASYKQLGDRVVEYRAQLLQLQGDEFGAAQLRAAQAIEAARILSRQSAGLPGSISEEQIRQQERALDVANRLAEIQRRSSQLRSDGDREEELFLLRSTQAGVTLRDQELGIYALRQQQLEQLKLLTEQAAALAAVSTDPKVRQAAADLALQYAKALDSINPAINRLRASLDGLSQSIASSLSSALSNYSSSYKENLRNAREETVERRRALDEQLLDLRSALARSSDAKEKALLKDLIRQAELQRKEDSSSRADVALKTIERDFLRPLGKLVQETIYKTIIEEPLRQSLQGTFRQVVGDSSSGIGALLRSFVGVGTGSSSNDPTSANYENSFDLASSAAEALKAGALTSQAATSLQTSAISSNTSAMIALTTAANAAAGALASVAGNSIGSSIGSGFSSIFAGNNFLENPFAAVALDTGTNYVPYDGMKATLHKGEAVVPAKYNPAAGGQAPGGRMNVQIFNNAGANVRAEEGPGGDLRVFIEAAVSEVERRMASGGSTDRVMRQTYYGLGRALARRA